MRVRCLSDYPSAEVIRQMGGGFYKDQAFPITVGREYVVLGVQFMIGSILFGTGTVIQIRGDRGDLNVAPLALFEITDGKASRYWEARTGAVGELVVQPSSFYQEYYHDDLSEGVPEVMADFARTYDLLAAEASNTQVEW